MPHISIIIEDAAAVAVRLINLEDETEQARRRKQFAEQNEVAQVGASTIAFSVMCCDKLETIERHTIQNIDKIESALDVKLLMQQKVQQAAEQHGAVSKARGMMLNLIDSVGGLCRDCDPEPAVGDGVTPGISG